MTVNHYDWSAYHANVRPNKIAIRDLSINKELTYSELDIRSNKLAEWLQKNGVGKGDRVAILHTTVRNSLNWSLRAQKLVP
tara:strand:+ start:590 stop:832 length:243 start_codon:yes stop_codon:yes gene_type:complete